MEKRRLVNSAEMKKEKSKKISSKQLEARITAFTIILGSNCHEHIVVDRYTVLRVEQQPQYYGKLQNLSINRPCSTDKPCHWGINTKKESRYPSSKIPGTPFFYLLPYHNVSSK